MSIATTARRVRAALKGFAVSGPGRDRWQHPDRVVSALGLRAGDRAADLGSGAGYFTFRLARAVGPAGTVYAIDNDRGLLALLTARATRLGLGNIVGVEAGVGGIPLPEPVDLVLVVNAFHHLPDQRAVFAELARSLRPGGWVAVIEATRTGINRVIGHATDPAVIRTAMTAAGYRQIAGHDFLPRQSFQVFEVLQVA
jgi:ubiquinone/menaquinone biosynthesis C-methylase UbiE